MSRPSKPTEQLKRQGTYRPCRHDTRSDGIAANGRPIKPRWLDDEARWAWKTIVGHMHESVLREPDTLLLAGACRWWAIWRQCDSSLASGEGDAYKLTIQAGVAWKNLVASLTKMGISPVDRCKLAIPPQPVEPEGKARFFSRVVG